MYFNTCMCSLHTMHEMKTLGWLCPSVHICFTSETATEWILMKFGIWSLHWKLSDKFNFGLYWFSTAPTLHKAEIIFYWSPQNQLTEQKTATWYEIQNSLTFTLLIGNISQNVNYVTKYKDKYLQTTVISVKGKGKVVLCLTKYHSIKLYPLLN
jgi:hypothetical protein